MTVLASQINFKVFVTTDLCAWFDTVQRRAVSLYVENRGQARGPSKGQSRHTQNCMGKTAGTGCVR